MLAQHGTRSRASPAALAVRRGNRTNGLEEPVTRRTLSLLDVDERLVDE